MAKQKQTNGLFYKKPEWYIPIIIAIILAIFFGGDYNINVSGNNGQQNIDSPFDKSPLCTGDNCQQNINYNECDPIEILKEYDKLKLQNKTICENNLTNYYYNKCGFGLSAYYFDQCDIRNFTANVSSPVEYVRYLLVYPSWGKSENDYYFFDEYLIDEEHARISVFVTQSKQLKARFVENDGTEYILTTDASDWDKEEWGLIVVGLVENDLTLLLKNLHNESKNKLVTKYVEDFKLFGSNINQFWGSDINGENQANAVIAKTDIDYFLSDSKKYNSEYVNGLR